MRKSFFTLAPAALLMAFAGASQAAANAQIDITGNVQSTTCDVGISTNSLDLGTFKATAFTAAKTPVTGSSKSFKLTLNNCETLTANGTAKLLVSGSSLPGANDIFSSDGSKNTGVMLSTVAAPTTYISADTTVDVKAISDFNTETLDGASLAMQAGLASTSTTPDMGRIKAPITFSFVYN